MDEISDIDKRQAVCEWIDGFAPGLQTAYIVVTSRWTGYRKSDGIELGYNHMRADVKDFSFEQQADFLRKWTQAAYLGEPMPGDIDWPTWQAQQKRQASQQAEGIIKFLQDDSNRAVRELAAIPMLLQIIAVIWKERGILLQDRSDLFQAAINYLLDFRDRKRKLEPLLKASDARRVLEPITWWMQQEVKTDEVSKEDLHPRMQAILNTLTHQPQADVFCENIRDRAGLIADYGKTHYIFRHKSLREYLAGVQLESEMSKDHELMPGIIAHLGEDWWEEPLRFFMAEVDDTLFDLFMDRLFHSDLSKELSVKQQSLLRTLIGDARQRSIESLVKCLNDGRFGDKKKRYILDCLKTIGTADALDAVQAYQEKTTVGSANELAQDIIAERDVNIKETAKIRIDAKHEMPKTFRNQYEFNAEYIQIPKGSYGYTVEDHAETVQVNPLYFAKYPVTFKQYRQFIEYLGGGIPDMQKIMPSHLFFPKLSAFASECEIQGMTDYLGEKPSQLPDKLCSSYDKEKRFNGQDQPVVRISWYAARAYCLWLSALENAAGEGHGLEYRLPLEYEWQWAAGGGNERQYPWGKRDPSDKLANYDNNVGATTPVGQYPEGATPEGLMDMAGNVLEWMGNYYDDNHNRVSLRGGCWSLGSEWLVCSRRNFYYYVDPRSSYDDVGFRVVCSQSSK